MLAADEELGDLVFRMLFLDPHDSGIESDDTNRVRRDRPDNQSDGSSSDEEQMMRPWWPGEKPNNEEFLNEASSGDEAQVNKRWWQASKNNENQKAMKDGQLDPIDKATWPSGQGERKSLDSPDRSSPPLYEVELTASDEDDDGSVLELVIPMQSRYQRVPTSSPKKPKPKPRKFLCAFCCLQAYVNASMPKAEVEKKKPV